MLMKQTYMICIKYICTIEMAPLGKTCQKAHLIWGPHMENLKNVVLCQIIILWWFIHTNKELHMERKYLAAYTQSFIDYAAPQCKKLVSLSLKFSQNLK